MAQGLLPAQPVDAGNAQRSIKPPDQAGVEPESKGKPQSEPEVTAMVGTVNTGSVAEGLGFQADLVRAEAMLQVAQASFATIGTMYSGMLEFAQSALGRQLSDADRVALDAAFQRLRQQIGDIVKAAVFDGAPLLGGGKGPDGEYVIALSAPRRSDGPLRFLIPAFSVSERLEGFREADLLTVDTARIATVGARTAVQIARFHEEIIELQRAGLHRIYAAEIGKQPVPDPGQTAEDWARSISNGVREANEAPFQQSAARMRNILELASNGAGLRAADVPTTSAVNDPGPVSRRPDPQHEDLQVPVGFRANADVARPVSMAKGVAGDADPVGKATAPVPGRIGQSVDGRSEMAAVPAVNPPPVAAPAAVLSVQDDMRQTAIAQSRQSMFSQYHRLAGQKADAVRQPGTVPLERTGPGTRADRSGEPFVATVLDLRSPGNRAASEVLQTELSKIGELDMARRASGLVHQVRDADMRADAGLTVARTVYEDAADRIQEFGGSVPVEPGTFMAELVKADTMLLVADLAIEQIDLHLDYLSGLAGESATDGSRDRAVLDEIFQAVKANIIDGLAQTTEVRGEKILAGGGGPGGAYLIHLSDGGGGGEGHDIVLPSMRLENLSPDLHVADIRTKDDAVTALSYIDQAGADTARTRDMIAEERALIQRLLSLESARNGSRAPLARSTLGL